MFTWYERTGEAGRGSSASGRERTPLRGGRRSHWRLEGTRDPGGSKGRTTPALTVLTGARLLPSRTSAGSTDIGIHGQSGDHRRSVGLGGAGTTTVPQRSSRSDDSRAPHHTTDHDCGGANVHDGSDASATSTTSTGRRAATDGPERLAVAHVFGRLCDDASPGRSRPTGRRPAGWTGAARVAESRAASERERNPLRPAMRGTRPVRSPTRGAHGAAVCPPP